MVGAFLSLAYLGVGYVTIHLGCHMWTFPQNTVSEAARIVRALGLDYMDLGNARDLDPNYVAANIGDEAARLRRVRAKTGITFVDAFPQLSPGFSTNHPDPAIRAAQRQTLTGFLEFAEQIGLSGVTFSPGRYWPGQSPGADFERGAEELRWLVAEGLQRGLQIRIEPHIASVTWIPELTLQMLAAVPGLSLTLDYSHFIFHAIPHDQIALLDRHATHWHARQARPGEAQCSHAEGVIDFAQIVSGLRACDYTGVICLEYVHGAWMQQDRVDCLSETVLLRDQLWGLLQ